MKLGEMLTRDGRITPEELQVAIDRQQRDGGRIGTVLVEMGLVDLDSLTIYLGLELGIPVATGPTLERVKKTAVQLLSAEDAARFRCIPIVIQHRQLIAAIDSPHDQQALDELSRITSYRVVPRVAPELRIYYYLQRYYGVTMPERFATMGESPRGSVGSAGDSDLPAHPLPGLPPPTDSPTQAPNPAPIIRRAQSEPPPPLPSAQELELEAADLLEVLEADEADTAERSSGSATGVKVSPEARKPATYQELDKEEAFAAIAAAENRSGIASAIMGFAAGIFDVAVLMVVRGNLAFGWLAYGDGLDEDRIETLLLPLETPSIFQMAQHGGSQYHGHAFPSSVHDYLFKVLRCERPPFSLVSSVKIGERSVNLLYGHTRVPLELAPEVLDEIQAVCATAGNEYQRLIKSSRERKRAKTLANEVEKTTESAE